MKRTGIRRFGLVSVVAGTLLAANVCWAQARQTADAEQSPQALLDMILQLVRDLRSNDSEAQAEAGAALRSLALPNATSWFQQRFGAAAADRLAREHRQLTAKLNEIGENILACVREGKTDVEVVRIDSLSREASGFQNGALQRMKTKTALFVVRFRKPGEKYGSSFGSFVWADGRFRFIGDLQALWPDKPKGDLTLDILCKMPLEAVEKLLQEKQLLEGSAAEYLIRNGILLDE